MILLKTKLTAFRQKSCCQKPTPTEDKTKMGKNWELRLSFWDLCDKRESGDYIVCGMDRVYNGTPGEVARSDSKSGQGGSGFPIQIFLVFLDMSASKCVLASVWLTFFGTANSYPYFPSPIFLNGKCVTSVKPLSNSYTTWLQYMLHSDRLKPPSKDWSWIKKKTIAVPSFSKICY